MLHSYIYQTDGLNLVGQLLYFYNSFLKDTLLISREIKQSVSKRIGIYAVTPALKASFSDAQAAQKKNWNKVSYKSEPYLRTQGTKARFSLSRNADNSVNSMPICANYSQIRLRHQ